MKQMSLAQYRASIKVMGERSSLFQHKSEIFDALQMGLSHAQVQDFLTTQKGLKISVRAVSKWIKTHKTFDSQKPAQNQPNNVVQKKREEVVNQPNVEPKTEAPILPNDDDFYNHLRKVADKRAKWLGTNPYIKQEEI